MDTLLPARRLRRIARLLLLSASLALDACASLPRSDVQPAVGPIRVAGVRGPLSRRRARQVLARLAAEAPGAGSLRRHLAIEQAIADSPLYTDSYVRVLRDGNETFPALFAAIRAARSYVHLEYYIFEDVICDGERLSDLLLRKRQQGVAVSLIYDGIGSLDTPATLFAQLQAAGVQMVEFNPPNPFKGDAPWSINDRDHRKILVADGTVAIIGGINLSTAYERGPSGSRQPAAAEPDSPQQQPWRDTDLEIHGAAVRELDRLFHEHWREQDGAALTDPTAEPAAPAAAPAAATALTTARVTATTAATAATAVTAVTAATAATAARADDGEVVRIIGSSPRRLAARYYVTVLSAIRNAERSVWITCAYFVPTHEEVQDLKRAARRGVDVRLLVPSESDSSPALIVQRSHYAGLLKAGVHIYERDDAILHSKTMVVDGVWSIVGSSNFDNRSVLFNDEVDAVVIGRETGARLQAMFQQDLQHAHPVEAADWQHRSLGTRAREIFWRVWEQLL